MALRSMESLADTGNKTPLQRVKLAQKREENRTLLRFVRDASLAQRRRGGALLGENPKPSLAWKEPLIEEAFNGMPFTICEGPRSTASGHQSQPLPVAIPPSLPRRWFKGQNSS